MLPTRLRSRNPPDHRRSTEPQLGEEPRGVDLVTPPNTVKAPCTWENATHENCTAKKVLPVSNFSSPSAKDPHHMRVGCSSPIFNPTSRIKKPSTGRSVHLKPAEGPLTEIAPATETPQKGRFEGSRLQLTDVRELLPTELDYNFPTPQVRVNWQARKRKGVRGDPAVHLHAASFCARGVNMLQQKRLVSAGHMDINVLRRSAQASAKLIKVWKHLEVSQFHCQVREKQA